MASNVVRLELDATMSKIHHSHKQLTCTCEYSCAQHKMMTARHFTPRTLSTPRLTCPFHTYLLLQHIPYRHSILHTFNGWLKRTSRLVGGISLDSRDVCHYLYHHVCVESEIKFSHSFCSVFSYIFHWPSCCSLQRLNCYRPLRRDTV